MMPLGAWVLTALTSVAVFGTSSAVDWHTPWREPHAATAAAETSDEYAWRLFVALNWPGDVMTRAADRSRRFGAPRPVTWETWKSAGDAYLEQGADPGPWLGNQDRSAATERRFEVASLKDFPNLRRVVGGVMVPLDDPIAAARRLTEIRMNRAAFDYIRARELYNVEGQIRAYGSGQPVAFPSQSIEVKAKWRPIEAQESARYHTTSVKLADGTQRLYGLTALHIASKVLPHWFWATFEHVDNPTLRDNEGWQLPSRDTFSCGPAADCNRMPAGIGLEGTVWRYYRLRGTLTQYQNAAREPQRLANSELETGMQTTASCMTCHSRAAIAVIGRESLHLAIFDERDDSPYEALTRRGFVGVPHADWFDRRSGEPSGLLFRPLDFVWSMTKAQHKLQ